MQKIIAILLVVSLFSCKKRTEQKEHEIYSRHLQEHFKLTSISSRMPDDKSKMNLLLLNDGQDIDQLRIKEIMDSLYKKKAIQPLLVIGIHANDRMQEYGVSGYPDYQNNGSKADKYEAFVIDELLPFIKKQAAIRKFNSVAIAGCSLGGLSAFDIAWNNHDKIDKVGVFSGSFWWRDKDVNDKDYSDANDRIMLNKIRSSRKKPHLQYWFYAGTAEETGDRDKDGVIDVIDDTKDLIELIKSKNVCPPSDIIYKETINGKHEQAYWSNSIAEFLVWAFPAN